MNDTTDRAQAEILKLSEALLLCQRELAQLREQQEGWEEKFSQLRSEARGAAERSTKLAGMLARPLADAYWHSRGRIPPGSLRDFIAARWPRLRKLVGRQPSPEVLAETRLVQMIEASPRFDARWYLEHNPDVAEAGAHPALHYLLSGGAEGRDPGPDFDSKAYRRQHPDLAPDANPLLHWLQSRDA
ncbi:MAG TPA: hypothetical protein VFY97_08030 [Rhodanobacteraceae bacterium]|nr:hypothetical protein [Rhodanobacteraceae bacterium]